jgi:methionyl aminopeptidase
MVYIKTKEEIAVISQGGKILGDILKTLGKMVKPGVNTEDIEKEAVRLIEESGGRPAFLNYDMGDDIYFPSAVCASLNDEVVHGSALPGRVLKSGDIIDLDIGMEWPVDLSIRAKIGAPVNKFSLAGGFYSDTCATFPVGKISQEAKKLLKISRQCLEEAIKKIKPGNTLNDIGRTVQFIAETNGYGVVRDLVGHGVGYLAHEDPNVCNYAIPERSADNLVLKEGMVIAVEPMINLGTWKVKVADNDYTILTADGSLSAHFEHTIAVTKDGCEVLT